MLELKSTIAKIEVEKYYKENGYSGAKTWYYSITDTETGKGICLTEEEAETLFYTLGVMVKQGRPRR